MTPEQQAVERLQSVLFMSKYADIRKDVKTVIALLKQAQRERDEAQKELRVVSSTLSAIDLQRMERTKKVHGLIKERDELQAKLTESERQKENYRSQVRISDEAFNFHLKRANDLMEKCNELEDKLTKGNT